MEILGVNDGHTLRGAGTGAVGRIKEGEHTRLVGEEVRRLINESGNKAINCTVDYANTVTESLELVVQQANREELDWFISIHFNAGGGNGVEVYTYEGRQYQDALDVCKNISDLGFRNRGVKAGTGLYVIRRTKAKSMLIEVCFVDTSDAEHYLEVGYKDIARAIVNGLLGYVNVPEKNEAAENTTSYDYSMKDKIGVVTGNDVRVRDNANLNNSRILGYKNKGEKVRIGFAYGDFYNIYFGSHGGWIHKSYVKTDDQYGVVTAKNGLYIRKGPGTNYDKLGALKSGDRVHIDFEENGWYSIFWGDHGGWISSDYVSLL